MASHRFVDHPGELHLRVRAESLGEVMVEAGRALGTLQLGQRRASGNVPWMEIEVHSTDREALLVDWLNDLIYRAETDGWIPLEFTIREVSDRHLSVRARGGMVNERPALVKAATLHGVRIQPVSEGLEADVVFDV